MFKIKYLRLEEDYKELVNLSKIVGKIGNCKENIS